MTPLRAAIVGGGRSRNGLGPFLARFFEAAGGTVVAAVGRNPDRAAVAADQLAQELGHDVLGAGSLSALDPEALDAVIIASPVETHLPALRWAAEHELHTLCEKPLVQERETDRVAPLLEQFARAGATLMENCQWPQVLGAYRKLGRDRQHPVTSVAMGLGPAGRGRVMVEDSLSHVLSLAQAVGVAGGSADGDSLPQVRYHRRGEPAEHVVVEFALGAAQVPVRLQLDHCPEQPRPAWLALNGRRADRVIEMPAYRMALSDGVAQQAMDDPMRALVYGFVHAARRPEPQRNATLRAEIHERARLYQHILQAW